MVLMGLKWPWEAAPKTPAAVIQTIISEPAIIPAAAPLAVVTKSIFKVGAVGALIAGGAGFLAGSLLGGGGTQTVQPTQPTITTPTQLTPLQQMMALQQKLRDIQAAQKAAAEAKAAVTIPIQPETVTTTTYDVTAGGAVDIGGVSTTQITSPTTTTITHAGISQGVIGQLSAAIQAARQDPAQITIVTPTQETTATQMDTGLIAILAAAGIVAAALIFGGKKRGR